MKTEETKSLEEALHTQSQKKREYGCEEVTIGFKGQGHGDEIVDFMTMDSHGIFKCYELKVTLSDLKSDHKMSFYGDYNYLVVGENLYDQAPVWDNYIPPYVGILVGMDLSVKRQAKKKSITSEQKDMLKDSLLRSVYYKMENYRNAENLDTVRNLQRELVEEKEKNSLEKASIDRKIWTYDDYEFYYRKNHQAPQFSLEEDAQRQRKEYALRQKNQFTWIEKQEDCICPNCGAKYKKKDNSMNYCPSCGTDLRYIKD